MWNVLLGLNIFRGYVGFSECITSRKGSFCQNHLSVPIENWVFSSPSKLWKSVKWLSRFRNWLRSLAKLACRVPENFHDFVAVEKKLRCQFCGEQPSTSSTTSTLAITTATTTLAATTSAVPGWGWGLISSCVGWGGVVISYHEKKGWILYS